MQITIGKSMLDPAVLSAFPIDSYTLRVPGLERPVIIRAAGSDQEVFRSIFVRSAYRHHYLPPAATIVDAGANVGYSVLWFRRQFPQARIVALEPDPRNFACLQANCGHLDDVLLLNAALWRDDGELALQTTLDGKPMQSWSTRTVAAAPGGEAATTPAYAMRTVMAMAGIDHVDLVKIDIEGAEKDVFEAADLSWLDATSVLTLELHDRFRPGCAEALRDALAGRAHESARKGENVWFRFAQRGAGVTAAS